MAVRVDDLAKCFEAAKEAARQSATEDDGGTCNLDSPAFRIPRCRDSVIQEAAGLAGVTAAEFQWFGGKRWYWLGGFLQGQGNCRSRMSHAATKALREQAEKFVPTMEVCEYCQMD